MRGPVAVAPADCSSAPACVSPAPDRGQGAPLCRQLRLAARPAAVPESRAMVRDLLREWRLEAMEDEATLLLSELMTNAVQASAKGAGQIAPGGPVVVATVRCTGSALLLEVWDASPALPVAQELDITSDCGRGLLMIECMSSAWGHHPADGGKVVWCELPCPG